MFDVFNGFINGQDIFGEAEDYDDLVQDCPTAPQRNPIKTCKYCGKGGFRWTQTDDGWRLSDASGIHECWKSLSKEEIDKILKDAD